MLQADSIHAVIGHNGAGKSTLMNVLSGVYEPSGGAMLIDGEPVPFNSPRAAIEGGVSMVHQELSIIPDLDITENIFIGREPLTRLGSVPRAALYSRSEQILSELELSISARTR